MSSFTHSRTMRLRASGIAAAVLAALLVSPAQPGSGITNVVQASGFSEDRNLTGDTPPPATPVDPKLGSTKSYNVYRTSDGSVIRWNPCAPIHYRVNLTYAPAGALTDVKAAVAKIASATGMDFVYDGSTTVIPQKNYGATSTPTKTFPVVIAWAKRGTGTGSSNVLGGEAYALGGWRGLSWTDGTGSHPMRAVTGFVVVDTISNGLPAGFATTPGGARGGLLLHELGHVVGLQHVTDTTQEMNPYIINRSSYGNGDKAGLTVLGASSGCIN